MAIQAGKRGDPQVSICIPFDGSDRPIAEAGRVVRIGLIADEGFRHRVVTVQSAAPCSNPEGAVPVLPHCDNAVMAKRGWVIGIMFENLEFITVITVESVLRADP